MTNTLPRIIAIDFDGTLCEDRFPDIGAPKMAVISAALEEQRNGTRIILWTCRQGKKLTEAVDWCKNQGLVFDAVNANIPESIEMFGGDNRKVHADVYWDDKVLNVSELDRTPAACICIYQKDPITKNVELKNKRLLFSVKEFLQLLEFEKMSWDSFSLILFKDNSGKLIDPNFLKWFDQNHDKFMRWEEFSNG